MGEPALLSPVALLEDVSEHRLSRGQVGAVVESLEPGIVEVEFCGQDGRTCALLPLRTEQLLVLRYGQASS